MQSTLQKIALQFGVNSKKIEPAGEGGFSGAGVWKVQDKQGNFSSVKRLTNVSADHLAWIHRVLLHTVVCDCDFVAAPRRTKGGNSFLETGDVSEKGLWEVCHWVPGEADFHTNSSDERLANAMKSLAKFHQSAAQVNFDFRPSPSIKTRMDGLKQLTTTCASILGPPAQFPALTTLLMQLKQIPAVRIQAYFQSLQRFEKQTLPLQPVIRDLWHDHLLFTGDQLTGLIDFDAMQMDTIAMDLTRCLGSLVPNDPQRWTFALNAYSSVRPIQNAELALIKILDPVNVILSTLNWLKWIAIDQRSFANTDAVETRLNLLVDRLGRLLWS